MNEKPQDVQNQSEKLTPTVNQQYWDIVRQTQKLGEVLGHAIAQAVLGVDSDDIPIPF